MAKSLFDRLSERSLVADGAMGTMLQAAGLRAGECGEEWNVIRRDAVKSIHRAYLEAGSDIILTNSFGGTRHRLAEYGKADQVEPYNRAAAELAREVADEYKALVFGDIGPSGKMLQPYGEATEEELFVAFREQAQALASGGVDALIVETMTASTELALAVRAAKEVSDLPVFASYSFNRVRDGYRTMMGEKLDACVQVALNEGADGVGSNCGLGIEDMIEVVRQLRAATDCPLICQPNAGLPEVVEGKIVYRQTPREMAEQVPQLIDSGAGIVGGCCGTNPEYIQLVKNIILKG